MDNRVFNVNGSGLPTLTKVLDLVIGRRRVTDWVVDPKKGLILLWCDGVEGASKMISPMTAEQVAPMVMAWLESDEAKKIPLSDWDVDCKHDGDNSPGWRVFVEDWGHVGSLWQATCCITPAFMWHGK